jgi:hypothetical protein
MKRAAGKPDYHVLFGGGPGDIYLLPDHLD